MTKYNLQYKINLEVKSHETILYSKGCNENIISKGGESI